MTAQGDTELIEENHPPVLLCPPQDSRGLMALNIPLHSKTQWLLCVPPRIPFNNPPPWPKSKLTCSVRASEERLLTHTALIKKSVFITKTYFNDYAVRTEYLIKFRLMLVFKVWKKLSAGVQTVLISYLKAVHSVRFLI